MESKEILGILAAVAFAGVLMSYKPLGIRNNNPGNIRYNEANNWNGQTGQNAGYVVFSEPVYGIRALAKLLSNYHAWYGMDTVNAIINKWAPPAENDTAAYVADVSQRVGVTPTETLDFATQLPDLVKAIIWHENGQQPYSDALIAQGVAMA